MSRVKRERIAVYIDGFNLYHAIHDLKQPHLKWVNLRKLSDYLIKTKTQRIVSVKYFSAFAEHFARTDQIGSLRRHRAYVKALESKGVICLMGNFAKRDRVYSGKGYRARWRRHEGKQTDVGIGVHLVHDAHLNRFDRALVIGVDTDLLPAFKLMKADLPHKPAVCVAPPHRAHHRDLQAAASGLEVIKVSQLQRALFGPTVVRDGAVIARRPVSYKPPFEVPVS
jgi:uncharacterized LabA/DUF88 family protein